MNAFWHYYVLTFKRIFGNGSVLVTMILSVVFYSFFYPAAYQSQQGGLLPVVVVDEAPSQLSARLINAVEKSENVEVVAVVSQFSDATSMLKQQQADAIVLLPAHMENNLRQGGEGLGVYVSTAYFLRTKQIAAGLVGSMASVVNEYLARFSSASAYKPEQLIHPLPLFNPLSGYGSYIVPAVAPLIIHQTILLGLSMLVAGWRETGWRLREGEFAGMVGSVMTIGCLGCLYLFGFMFWLNDYPRAGNFSLMLIAIPLFVLAAIGLALVLASYLDMAERSGHLLVFTSVPLFLLSGVAWPLQAMPAWLAGFSSSLPSTVGINTFVRINQMGVTGSDVVWQLVYLGLVGMGLNAWAYLRLRQAPHSRNNA